LEENEFISINFKALWTILKKEKWLIFGITTLITVLGGIYAFSLKEEFVSEGRILPEVATKGIGMGQYAGLAALAGVDIAASASGTDAVRPDLYPDVLKATPFFQNLLAIKVTNKFNKPIKFRDFYNSEIIEEKLNIADLKSKYQNSSDYIVLDKQTENTIKNLRQRVYCSYDKKTGVLSISAKMPDPVVAASVAKYSMNYLTDYIINYRTEKLKRDLDFLGERLNLAKGKYYNKQENKASYSDRIPLEALRFQAADLQRERIEAEYKTASSFYNTLLQKYEEAKLKIQQETPVIKILEPPVVPNLKAEPKKSIILLGFLFVGFIISLILAILIRGNYKLLFKNNA
jgi:uncharacterized protein involved in exopolysaccharide biosynthesis